MENLKIICWLRGLFFSFLSSLCLSLYHYSGTFTCLQPLEPEKGKESLRQSDLLGMEGGQGNSLTPMISTKFSLGSDKTLIWCSHQWLAGEMEWMLSTVSVLGGSFDYKLTCPVMAVGKLTLEEMSRGEIWGEQRSDVWLKWGDAHGSRPIKKKHGFPTLMCTKWWDLLTSKARLIYQKRPGQHN